MTERIKCLDGDLRFQACATCPKLASKEQELADSRKQWENLAAKCDRLSEANCDLKDMNDEKDKRIKELAFERGVSSKKIVK